MLRVADRLEAGDVADRPKGHAIGAAPALVDGVLQPQLDGVHAELLREVVDRRLDGELGGRGAGRAVGLRARLVDHDVPADRAEGRHGVRRGGAHRAGGERRARVRAGLVGALPVDRGDRAVALRADADANVRARGRAGALEDLGARHLHLHRAVAALAREQAGQRLHVDRGLAAEAATDLDGVHADLRDRVDEQLRELVAHAEVGLRAHPDVDLAVLAPQRGAVVRLDVALVVHRRVELALDHDLGVAEPGIEVAVRELDALRDVRGARAVGRGAAGAEEAKDLLGHDVVVNHRRLGRHRILHVRNGLERLVLDLDQVERVFGDVRVSRGDRRDRVPAVERLVRGEDVVEHPARAGRLALAEVHRRIVLPREVGVRDHRGHSGQRLRLRGIDVVDQRVGVRAAQHAAVEHPRQPHVGAVDRATVDLVDTVGADRRAADDLELRALAYDHGCLPSLPGEPRASRGSAPDDASSESYATRNRAHATVTIEDRRASTHREAAWSPS